MQVSPDPVTAKLVSTEGSIGIFEVTADVTFRESAGVEARVTEVRSTVTRSPSGVTSVASASAGIVVPAYGSAGASYTTKFEVGADVDSVRLQFDATFVDAKGRTFTARSGQVTVNPPTAAAPPPPSYAGTGRLLLFGGSGYGVYLGCFSCNQFSSESVHNQFGKYGSRFSSTSIWNHFSDYGSRFSNDSACNRFATNPPILVDEVTRKYQELTVNQLRTYAIRDATVVAWLQNVVCEGQY